MTEKLHQVAPSPPDERMRNNPNRTPEADRRLEAFDATIRRYQSEYPFVEGATVFGSTMHGGAHEQSDVDGFVFIDPDKLAEQAGEVTFDSSDYTMMASAIERDVLSAAGIEQGSTSSGRRNDIQVFPVNDRVIEEAVGQFERSSAVGREMDRLRAQYYDDVNFDGTFDEFAERAGVRLGDISDTPMIDWGVAALFHPTVGDPGKVGALRQKVLRRVADSSAADQIWRDISSRIYSFEGDMHSGEAKFPETLEEALEQFAD